MKVLVNSKMRWLFVISFLVFGIVAQANKNLILCNDENIVNSRAISEIRKIGDELREKSGVSVYLCVKRTIGKQKIKEFERSLIPQMKRPYVLLAMSVDNQKVDIITSKESQKLLDTNAVLSPFGGTIIPILTSHKTHDKYSAAMLNGYADITDRIASNEGIKLKSSVGDTNRILVDILRFIVYGSFLYFVIIYLRNKYYKSKKKNEKK